MMEEENIEQLFREQFSGFSVPPPAELKIAIDRQIRRKRRLFLWIFGTALIFGAGYCSMWLFTTLSASSTATHQVDRTATGLADSSSIDVSSRFSSNSAGNRTSTGDPNTTGTIEHEKSSLSAATSSTFDEERRSNGIDGSDTSGKRSGNGNLHGNRKKSTRKRQKTTSTMTAIANNTSDRDRTNVSGTSSGDERAAPGVGNTKTASTEANSGTKSGNQEDTSKENGDTQQPKDSSSIAEKKAADTSNSVKTNPDKQKQPSDNASKKWYAEIKPGLVFNTLSKSEVKATSSPAFGMNAGFYRQLNLGPLTRAGLDFSYVSGNFSWSEDSTIYSTQTLDSLYTYFNPQDSMWHTDTIYYTTTSSSIQTSQFKSTLSQFAAGLSTQFDMELTDRIGIVVSPAFRYARTKFVRNSDSKIFKSGSFQLNLGLDVYYDRNYWRFLAGIGYGYTWIKPADNPLNGKGTSVLIPRIGIGFRF